MIVTDELNPRRLRAQLCADLCLTMSQGEIFDRVNRLIFDPFLLTRIVGSCGTHKPTLMKDAKRTLV